jgi:tRNA U34 5-methylaminomethyl-2-thiouridine-forming methyltransferase MnmC
MVRQHEMNLQIKKTADNSDTLYLPDLGEHYHSIYGAWQESVHVFIKEGFLQIRKPAVAIFEMGFGTGLNTLLSMIEAQKNEIEVTYHSIDLCPLKLSLMKKLNHMRFIDSELHPFASAIYSCQWEHPVPIGRYFYLTKIKADVLKYHFTSSYDLVYWDAFAPDKQPELWQTPLFQKVYESMVPKGILVTYAAKGQVRRNLEAAGFMVNRIPGPPGKREMIRAVKPEKE